MYFKSRLSAPQCLNLIYKKVCPFNQSRAFRCVAVCHKKKQALHELMNYSAPFSKEEKLSILNKLNEEPLDISPFIRKSSIIKFNNLKKKVNKFESVEQILEVDNFSIEMLEAMCQKILKANIKKDPEIPSLNELPVTLKAVEKPGGIIKPEVTKLIVSQTETVLGVKFSKETLSYCHMDYNKQILDWGYFPIFTKQSKVNFEHYNLYEKMLDLVNSLPVADLYLFEDSSVGNVSKNKDLMGTLFLDLAKIQTSLVTLMNCKRSFGEPNMTYSFKYNAIAKLFSLSVGGERVTSRNVVNDLLTDTGFIFKGSKRAIRVIINDELKDVYKLLEAKEQDQMSNSLLLSTAFVHYYLSHKSLRHVIEE